MPRFPEDLGAFSKRHPARIALFSPGWEQTPMSSYIKGQRWISESEPELGLATVVVEHAPVSEPNQLDLHAVFG